MSLGAKYLSFFLLLSIGLMGQVAEEVEITEATDPDDIMIFDQSDISSSSMLKEKIMSQRRILEYPVTREADIFWEKYIWGVIDTREKMNLTFTSPHSPFFKLMVDAIGNSDIVAYTDDTFEEIIDQDAVNQMLFTTETTTVVNPETYEEEVKTVTNEMDYNSVKKFRIKEVWFFDKKSSVMRVRIVGIAPLQDKSNETGEITYEEPLFWIYWPQARHYFARHKAYTVGNDANTISWDDYLEMRYFSYYITKESNTRDVAIKNLPFYQGDDIKSKRMRMLKSMHIKEEIFNFEHDLWSY